MTRFMGALLPMIAATALIFSGCAKNSPIEPNLTNEQYFMNVVSGEDATTSDLAISSQTALDDGAMYAADVRPLPARITSGSLIVPQKWGRFITSVTRTITRSDTTGDTVATALTEETFNGNYVIIGTVNGVLDTIRKPFSESMHRMFRFVRIANTSHPRFNWRLDAVSILNGGTTNAQISIQQIQVLAPNGDTLTATDPDTYFMQLTRGWMRHPIPLWGPNATVTVNATLHSNDVDTDLVDLHYVPRDFGLHRTPMTLVSQTADASGGFLRVYSQTFTIPGNGRKFSNVAVSATTNESLYSTDTTNFSSSIWGVPYKTSE